MLCLKNHRPAIGDLLWFAIVFSMVATLGCENPEVAQLRGVVAKAQTDAQRCDSSKAKGAGKHASCLANVYSKAIIKQTAVDTERLTRCTDKIVSTYDKAELKGGLACSSTGNAATVEGLIDGCVSDVIDDLGGAPGAGGAEALCQGKKAKTAGKYLACKLNAQSKAIRKGEAPDFDRCIVRYFLGWLRLESSSSKPCATSGDNFAVQTQLDLCYDIAAASIDGVDFCGNGLLEGAEECDDGNTAPGDGCDDLCMLEPFCGDGNVDPGEECDDSNTAPGDGCDENCLLEPFCGDGTTDPGEECDDGNTVSNDGCSDVCVVEVCGDGIIQSGIGEECDDGNTTPGDSCDEFCQIEPTCGNGAPDPGEECDDGNNMSGDGCAADCTLEPFCGDNNIDPGETCDDGNTTPGDGCDEFCQVEPFCGDNNIDPGEECDDGNTTPDDGCDALCQLECGNGSLDGAEECDDGNTTSGDGCSATCTIEPAAFRLLSLDIQEPTFILPGSCGVDLGAVIGGLISDAITMDGDMNGNLDLSLILNLDDGRQSSATSPGTLTLGDCPVGTPTVCTATAGAPQPALTYNNQGTDCTIGSTTVPAGSFGCFFTDEDSITIDIGGIMIPLESAQAAAQYNADPATALPVGHLRGFVSEATAMVTILPASLPLVGGSPLSDLLRGAQCPIEDERVTGPGGALGWFFEIDIDATAIDFTL